MSRLVSFRVGHALAGVLHGSCRGMVTLSFGVLETKVLHKSLLFERSLFVDTNTFIADFRMVHLLHLSGYNLILFILRGLVYWLDNIDGRAE